MVGGLPSVCAGWTAGLALRDDVGRSGESAYLASESRMRRRSAVEDDPGGATSGIGQAHA